MDYDVKITEDAEQDMESFLQYLLIDKKTEQTASSLLDDFEATIKSLKQVAGSLKLCENERLKQLGYRRINFFSHRYFILYRIEDKIAVVDKIFHELQDFEKKMI